MSDEPDEKEIKQCLFTGLNKKVFYFTNSAYTEDEIASDGFTISENIELCMQNVNGVAKKYSIISHDIVESLKKQLGLLGTSHDNFSFPDPTIVCLKHFENSEYLVLTELDNDLPSLAFYKLGCDEKDIYGTVEDVPSFRINRAELLVDCDDNCVSVLTNAALLSDQIPEAQEYLRFARLSAPSKVVKVSHESLLAASPDPLKEAQDFYTLTSSRDDMTVFRSMSYDFPCVEAILDAKAKGITFRFFGSDNRPPICLHFSLSLVKVE